MAQEEGREVALFLKILGVGREVKKMVDNSLDQCWAIGRSTIGIMLAFLMNIRGKILGEFIFL